MQTSQPAFYPSPISPSAQAIPMKPEDDQADGSQYPEGAFHPHPLAPTTSHAGQRHSKTVRLNTGDSPQPYKTNRLRKACDPCSLRKVKRGPPNRLAAALKRDQESQTSSPSPSPAASATSFDQKYLPSSPSSSPLTADSIAPFEIVKQLVDDYFTYLHPLQPFPHEPSFRHAFEQRQDLHDRYFLALLASMVGALVAAYPRRPRRRLKEAGQAGLFSHAIDFVRHCHAVVNEARGGGYMEREGLNCNDAATSFCLTVMCCSTYRWTQGNLYFGECTTIIRCTVVPQHSGYSDASMSEEHQSRQRNGRDHIEEEMIRRLWWTIFATVRSSLAFGASLGDVNLNPPTLTRKYPPMPAEVDDEYIHSDRIDPQPPHIVSRMAGFSANASVYRCHDALVGMDNASGMEFGPDVHTQRRILEQSVENLTSLMSNLPEKISLWHRSPLRSPDAEMSSIRQSLWGISPAHSPLEEHNALSQLSDKRRDIAYEIQKANLHVSKLSTRSLFVERYYDISKREYDRVQQGREDPARTALRNWIRKERETIAQEIIQVLSSIYPVHIEPNSTSLTMKLRQVASTLLPQTKPQGNEMSDGQGADAGLSHDDRCAAYMQRVVEILQHLEKGSGPDRKFGESPDSAMDEAEAEMGDWASFKQFQADWARNSSVAIRRA